MTVTLIVEDNTIFRQSLREILNLRFPSMIVEEAATGEDALERLKHCCPDIIFMDIRLPGENGLEISRRITSGDWAGTLIILTSCDLPEYRDAAFQSGASYFLTKGTATSNEIVALIESVVSGKNLNSLSRKSPNAMNN